MEEKARKDLRPGSVSKVALENGQMDLTGLRIGKQRLVSKKKKKSSLKKVIIEERMERQSAALGLNGTEGVSSGGVAWRPGNFSSMLSLDAPEFVPSAWSASTAAGGGLGGVADAPEAEPAEGASALPATKGGAAPAAEGCAAPAAGGAAPVPAAAGAQWGPDAPPPASHGAATGPSAGAGASGSAGGDNVGPAPLQVPTPVFVPSWCQGQAGERPPTPREWLDGGELPVTEALEQIRALKDLARPEQRSRQQQPQTRGDLEVRHYVHQVLSDELDEKVKAMLGELVRFQERAKERDPLKYAKQKRFCVGMREAKRSVTRNKAKCLILAPNLEVSTAEGGLDDTVEDLIEAAREAEVPVVFALSRNRIGKAMGKNIRLSIVAVLSADGVHQQFKEVLRITDDLRRQWVLRHMSQMTSEDAEEARRRAEEKVLRDAERRKERERRAEERRAEEERQRQEAKAAKEAEKARKAQERKAQIEKRRAEKAAKLLEEQQAAEDPERKAEDERREQAANEERERARREAERRAEEERRRILEELAAKEEAARAAAAAAGSDDDSDGSEVDLPAGFNDALF